MPGFFIDHIQGERAGATDHIDADVARVGRNVEFELYFDEMGVSWEHAEIRRRDGDFWVIDRGSTNGTYVNDERAHNARLRDGDILKFGKKGPVLRFRFGNGAPSPSGRHAAVPAPAPAAAGLGGNLGRPSTRLPAATAPVLAAVPAPGASIPLGDPLGDRVDGLDPVVAPPAPDDAPPHGKGVPAVPVPGVPRPRTQRQRRASEPDFPVPDPALLEARSDLPPAAPKPTKSGAWVTALLVSMCVLFLAAAAVAALLSFEMRDQDALLRNEKTRSSTLERELTAEKAGFAERLGAMRRERDELDAQLRSVQGDLERLRRRAEDDGTRHAERISQLERELSAARARRDVVPPDGEKPRSRDPENESNVWKGIERRVSRSVLFIAVRLEGRARDGSIVPLHGYGTGFFASAGGHVITNKHVVEPWKFRPMADKITAEGIEIIESSYQIHAWTQGSRFVREGGRELDLGSGYSTANGTLELVRTAPDRWINLNLPATKGPRAVRIHDEQSNEDLALLLAKVRQPVVAIPFANADTVEKLDDVLVVGYPAGPQILEAGVAETSPTLGKVRKVENTIFVSAAMVPGNSGGPLLDRRGRVVGICTRISEGNETVGSCLRAEFAQTLLQGGAW